ncbi:MAG TPA: hypothetical protein VI451_08720 [Anaerolineales bacterium]|nr:hypothetical protein [Anaerolineales bacterium]
MNIRLGIYEIFSRIIPGGVYLAALAQLVSVTGLYPLDWTMFNNLSLISSAAMVVAAYLLGGVLDRLAIFWFLIFKPRGMSGRVLQSFKQKHQERWEMDFEDEEWGTLLAFIRIKHLDVANEIDRHNALSIMLRNVSLGFLFLVANQVIEFFSTIQIPHLILGLVLVIVSILLVIEARRFREFFYTTIYETILAYRINLEDRIKPVPPNEKPALKE